MVSNLVESTYQKAIAGLDRDILIAPYPVWYNYVMKLPVPQRSVYVVIVFHNQVFNGGFHQYFLNSYGQFAYETIDWLRRIEAFPQAAVLNRAIERLSLEEPTDERLISKIANKNLSCIVDFEEETFEYLNKLDDEYYACNENLEQLLGSFLARDVCD
ncbi:DMP19 family protein [Spirosoma aerophilum]